MNEIDESNPWQFRDNGEKVLTHIFCMLGVVLGGVLTLAGITYLMESQYCAKVPCSMFFFVLALAFFAHGFVFLPNKIACKLINWFKRKP